MINHFYWLALQNGTCTHKWNSLGISYNCQSMFESGQSPIDVVDSKLMGAAQAAAPPPSFCCCCGGGWWRVSSSFSSQIKFSFEMWLRCDCIIDWPFVTAELLRHRINSFLPLPHPPPISTERSSLRHPLQLLPLKFPCLLFHITLCRAWLEWSEFCYVLPSPPASEERVFGCPDRPHRRTGHPREHGREEHQVLSRRRRSDRREPQDQQLDGDLQR